MKLLVFCFLAILSSCAFSPLDTSTDPTKYSQPSDYPIVMAVADFLASFHEADADISIISNFDFSFNEITASKLGREQVDVRDVAEGREGFFDKRTRRPVIKMTIGIIDSGVTSVKVEIAGGMMSAGLEIYIYEFRKIKGYWRLVSKDLVGMA